MKVVRYFTLTALRRVLLARGYSEAKASAVSELLGSVMFQESTINHLEDEGVVSVQTLGDCLYAELINEA